jgi:hypothetical protein
MIVKGITMQSAHPLLSAAPAIRGIGARADAADAMGVR